MESNLIHVVCYKGDCVDLNPETFGGYCESVGLINHDEIPFRNNDYETETNEKLSNWGLGKRAHDILFWRAGPARYCGIRTHVMRSCGVDGL